MKTTYFLSNDDKIYRAFDIIKAANIVHRISIKTKEELLDYIDKHCKGIVRELDNLSVEDLVLRGEHVKAVILYRETHEGSCIKDGDKYVTELENKLKKNNKLPIRTY